MYKRIYNEMHNYKLLRTFSFVCKYVFRISHLLLDEQ